MLGDSVLLGINISLEHNIRQGCSMTSTKQSKKIRLLHNHAWTQTKIRTLSKLQKWPQMPLPWLYE